MAPKLSCRRILDPLTELQHAVCKLSTHRNTALRIVIASRFVAIPSAQRELWLEFAWIDQEYRVAVGRLAQFCANNRYAFDFAARN